MLYRGGLKSMRSSRITRYLDKDFFIVSNSLRSRLSGNIRNSFVFRHILKSLSVLISFTFITKAKIFDTKHFDAGFLLCNFAHSVIYLIDFRRFLRESVDLIDGG